MKHEPVSLDLGTIQVKFVNGRWVEGTRCWMRSVSGRMSVRMLAGNLNPMEGRALTVEEENRELHQRLTKLSSENNMLKYRNEVLMQMVCPRAAAHLTVCCLQLTVARLDLEKFQKVHGELWYCVGCVCDSLVADDALYTTGGYGG